MNELRYKTTIAAVIVASAMVLGLLLLVGVIGAEAFGSKSDETLQLSASGRSSGESAANRPGSKVAGDNPAPGSPDNVEESELPKDSVDPAVDPGAIPPSTPAPEQVVTPEDPEVVEGIPGVVAGNADIPTGPQSLPVAELQVSEFVAVANASTRPSERSPDPIDILQTGADLTISSAVATDFKMPEDNSIDSLAPNVSGCALQCVTKAVITPSLNTANLDLEVEVTVPARIDITLTKTDGGEQALFTSSGFKTRWSTNLSPLAAGAEYNLVLEAIDKDGQRQVYSHTLTTRVPPKNPGQFQDSEPGCAGRCITRATVRPTDRPDEVRFDVETKTPASVKIWVSTSEPGWVGGTPILPADALVGPTPGVKKVFSVEKAFLDPDTRYHVIVRAEDDHGIDYQVADFTTVPPPPVNVRTTFEQIFVQWDGDPNWGALDRGELSFSWGFRDENFGSSTWYGSRSEEKIHGGTIVTLEGPYTERWQLLDNDGVLLAPGVTAYERDDLFAVVPSLVEVPYDFIHGRANPAWGSVLTLDDLKDQQTCGEMGFEGAPPGDYCVQFETVDQDDEQFPNIQVIVSYHVDF